MPSLFQALVAVPIFCSSLADTCGIVPIRSSERFLDLRPGDAILAIIFFGMMSLALVIAIVTVFVMFGAFKGMLALVGVPPLVFLLTALLLRLTLETLLFFGRRQNS